MTGIAFYVSNQFPADINFDFDRLQQVVNKPLSNLSLVKWMNRPTGG